jgi:hypothetical protein
VRVHWFEIAVASLIAIRNSVRPLRRSADVNRSTSSMHAILEITRENLFAVADDNIINESVTNYMAQ